MGGDRSIVRTTSLIDVDNTLLDNDAAKVELDRRLADLLGEPGNADFWAEYETVRAEQGVVDIPRTIARTVAVLADRSVHRPLAELFMTFPFRDYIYPGALETLAFLRALGPVVILSDGDPVFQPVKIARSGLATVVDGYVLVFPHKDEHLPELVFVNRSAQAAIAVVTVPPFFNGRAFSLDFIFHQIKTRIEQFAQINL